MRILLLGGTGAMGIHLVQLLSEDGHYVTITSRTARASEHPKIKYIQGNARDNTFLNKILNDRWDVIIDFMVYNTTEFQQRVNSLLNATSQYVFLSSSRVYSDADDVITENTPRLLDYSNDRDFLSTDEYSLTKARQENILIDSGKNNWTIVRPYITFAENRLQLGVLEKEEWLYRALKGRTIVFSKEIASKITTLTYGYDVALAINSIVGEEKAYGESFHITNNFSHKWDEILEIYIKVITKHLGDKPKVLLLDSNQYNKMESHKPYQIKYDRLFNRRFDNSKIQQFYSGNFKPSLEALEESLNVFLKKPKFNFINWAGEAKKDKITKEHTNLREIKGTKQKIKYILYRYFK